MSKTARQQCDFCQSKLETDEDGFNFSFVELEQPSGEADGKRSVFEAEWRDKADILELRIDQIGRYPLMIYEKNYFLQASDLFQYEYIKAKK